MGPLGDWAARAALSAEGEGPLGFRTTGQQSVYRSSPPVARTPDVAGNRVELTSEQDRRGEVPDSHRADSNIR